MTLTDAHGGEGLDDAGLEAGDLVIADRAHGIWHTIQVALAALAYFIIRLTWSNLVLCTPEGQPFDLIAWLRSWPESQQTAEVTVVIADDPAQRPMRLVAGRLLPEQAQAAQERVRRQARKEKRTPHPNTLLAAQFCLLLTNLPAAAWPILVILATYRIRWQIEWCFRRWKDLCHLDQLPAYPAKIAEPVLLAKLLLILMMQSHLGGLPWGEWWTADEPAPVVSVLVVAAYTYLGELIRPTAAMARLLEDPTLFRRHLCASRRKRPLQLAEAARHLATQLCGLLPAPVP